jgi:hypothetical protein
MLPNETNPDAKPPALPEWQRLIFCIIIPNAIVYIPTTKFLLGWTPRGDNYAGGIVDLVAVWLVAAATFLLFLIPVTACTVRVAFYPWRRWYTALAGGFAGVAIGTLIGLAVYLGLKLLSN